MYNKQRHPGTSTGGSRVDKINWGGAMDRQYRSREKKDRSTLQRSPHFFQG